MSKQNANVDNLEDETERENDGGVLFYVNKSGFPISDFTWERMWNHVIKIHPDGENTKNKIRNNDSLPEIVVPQAPNFPINSGIAQRIEMIQKYMSDMEYNYTGTQFFEIRKNRPLSGLMDIAKDMIRETLPIKCLEAVILAIYLTNGLPGLDRFPIGFKSKFMGSVHRHVVLGVCFNGKYGALGMSRRDDLMYKPLIFKSLSQLILSYEAAYKKYWHKVKKVTVGLPVPHDPHSYEQISWKHLKLSVTKVSSEDLCKELEKHAREIRIQTKTVPNMDSSNTGSPKKSEAKTSDKRSLKKNGVSKKSPKEKDTKLCSLSSNDISTLQTDLKAQDVTIDVEKDQGQVQGQTDKRPEENQSDKKPIENDQQYKIRI